MTAAEFTTQDLIATVNAMMNDARRLTEAEARPVYEAAHHGVTVLEERTGADLTVVKNNISTARRMHFMPGAAQTHAKRVADALKAIAA